MSIMVERSFIQFEPQTESLASFVRRMCRDATKFSGRERRARQRYPIGLAVRSTPVDRQMQPLGESFVAVTRDISPQGVSLYHTESVAAEHLALELVARTGERMTAVVEILRCRQIGPLFEIAGHFVHP